MPDDRIALYEFRRKLDDLSRVEGRATELISLYVPPGRAISDVSNYLKNEYSQASNIKSRTTRKHVLWAIESLITKLKHFRKPPPTGVVFFVGAQDVDGSHTRYISEVVFPPEPIQSFIYRCDSRFFLEPLHSLVLERDLYGLILIDRAECTLGFLKGKRLIHVRTRASNVPSKHGRGGQSARRFERLIEQAAHEWFKRMGEQMKEVFLPKVGELKGILLGGPGPTKEYFARENYIHYELKRILITPYFDVGYTNEFGLRELVEKAAERITTLDISREKSILERFLREVREAEGGLAVYGEAQVRRALELGAVDTLLLSESLKKVRVEWECPSCGRTERETCEDKVDVRECQSCHTPMEKKSEVDTVRELSDAGERYGTRTELISPDHEQGQIFFKVFGGVGGLLRFRV